MNKLTVSTLLFFVAAAANAQTQVPNDFQAGTPARAADVNANFTTLETAVNTNTNDIISNTDAISQSQSDVLANAAAIAANEVATQNNSSSIDANNQSITANSASIAINQAAIQTNSDEIAIVAARGPAMVKANGQVIGTFLQASGATSPWFLSASHIFMLSDTGYMFGVSPWSAPRSNNTDIEAGDLVVHRVRFDGPNCTGQAYMVAVQPDAQAQFFSGYVFTSEHIDNPTPVFYSPVGSTVVANVPIQSSTDNGGVCGNGVGTLDFAVAVFPNDPLITGVPSQRNLGAPITLGR